MLMAENKIRFPCSTYLLFLGSRTPPLIKCRGPYNYMDVCAGPVLPNWTEKEANSTWHMQCQPSLKMGRLLLTKKRAVTNGATYVVYRGPHNTTPPHPPLAGLFTKANIALLFSENRALVLPMLMCGRA